MYRLVASAVLLPFLWRGAHAEPTLVLDTDFPDPCIIETNGRYYAFATGGNGVNIQIASSPDFNSWSLMSGVDALPGPFPSWVASAPATWAPDVNQLSDGTYVMYFSAASSQDSSKHCFGAATSTSIIGPYTPEPNPIACPLDQGGAIDADGFNDNGNLYVVYKIDGNSLDGDGTTHPTPIMLQALEADGVTPTGSPIQLIDRSDADGPLIEAPSLARVGGTYYLTFSSNYYNTMYYDISYATASSITGPWSKAQAPNAPLLVSGDASTGGNLGGPGGADFNSDGSAIVFHAFLDGKDINQGRAMYTAELNVGGGVITVAGGT